MWSLLSDETLNRIGFVNLPVYPREALTEQREALYGLLAEAQERAALAAEATPEPTAEATVEASADASATEAPTVEATEQPMAEATAEPTPEATEAGN
ncbi:MAG: hypothetical protein HC915_00295 [Anaerolineae bacterium]|nr:hypothetical protein [Anaerolineae bacterium]